jgi:hypothetical protein
VEALGLAEVVAVAILAHIKTMALLEPQILVAVVAQVVNHKARTQSAALAVQA